MTWRKPWMWQVGVEGDLFWLHRYGEECDRAGCVEADPGCKEVLDRERRRVQT